ncbi:MAG: hypothetical protein FWD31_06665, partial [Planctomycetaceae bacterium]|nr:hypothetical protein [Planctomycetaceae bacterium]
MKWSSLFFRKPTVANDFAPVESQAVFRFMPAALVIALVLLAISLTQQSLAQDEEGTADLPALVVPDAADPDAFDPLVVPDAADPDAFDSLAVPDTADMDAFDSMLQAFEGMTENSTPETPAEQAPAAPPLESVV